MTLKELPLSSLSDDPRNPNVCSKETLAKLEANITRTGLCPPLIVRPKPKKKNQYIVIDGHHRKQVLKKLGWKKVPCQVWEVSDTDAQLALATLNRLHGTDIPKKRAELLVSLTKALPIDELVSLIPESKDEIEDMLQWMAVDEEKLQTALNAEIQKEQSELPIPYSFLIPVGDKPTIDEALDKYNHGPDRGSTLVHICKTLLEVHDD